MIKHCIIISLFCILVACQSKSNATIDESTNSNIPISATTTSNPQTDDKISADANISDSGARLEFEKERYHFGSIWHAEKVTHEFKFTNTGTDPLVISHVRASCGCTKPSWSKEPIGPGESSAINVVYNSVGKKGGQRATIRVYSNDPLRPEVALKLLGTVKVKSKEEYDKERAAKANG